MHVDKHLLLEITHAGVQALTLSVVITPKVEAPEPEAVPHVEGDVETDTADGFANFTGGGVKEKSIVNRKKDRENRPKKQNLKKSEKKEKTKKDGKEWTLTRPDLQGLMHSPTDSAGARYAITSSFSSLTLRLLFRRSRAVHVPIRRIRKHKVNGNSIPDFIY